MICPNTSLPPRTPGLGVLSQLEFDAATHIYRDPEGRVVPGVTSVLEPLQLYEWEDNPYITAEILEAARDFGQNVHLACHLFDMGELDEAALSLPLVPYLNGWKAFLLETGATITHSEEMVWNIQAGYAGMLDKRGLLAKRRWLIDIKSGALPWTVGYQTAAYQEALPAGERPRNRMAVQLLPNGRYRIHEQKDTGDFQIFLSALNIYKAKARKRTPINVSEYG
jgi:hypothetical protein